MKLLSVLQARSIWVMFLNELNPRGINLIHLFQPLIARYNFQIFPTKVEDLIGKEVTEIKFSGGTFNNIGIELIIFNWGLVAQTRSSTVDSDAFLNDLLTWVSTEVDVMPYYEVLRTKVYLSELQVQTDKPLNALNPKLINFSKRLTELIEGHEYHPIAFETSGISLWTDPMIANVPGPFKFERQGDVPFGENRYYSAAPLQTDIHLEILEELEAILSSPT
ncbi:MAG: hypothetical protein ACOZF2_17315 [Thermodesulfobacteriota bacterium]